MATDTPAPLAELADRLTIRPGEHVFLAGSTGSGKTVLSRKLLERIERGIVIDPKAEYRAEGWRRAFHLYPWEKSFRHIWVPKRSDDDKLADLIFRAWKRKNLTIYVDELQSLTDRFPRATDTLSDVIRTGRSRNVSVWTATQRPAWVPRWFLSESHHKFIFTLLDKADRERAADVIGDMGRERLRMHTFLYHAPGMEEARRLTYDLRRGIIRVVENVRIAEPQEG